MSVTYMDYLNITCPPGRHQLPLVHRKCISALVAIKPFYLSLSLSLSIYLSIYLSITYLLPTYSPTYYLPTHLLTYHGPTDRPTDRPTYLPMYLPTYLTLFGKKATIFQCRKISHKRST